MVVYVDDCLACVGCVSRFCCRGWLCCSCDGDGTSVEYFLLGWVNKGDSLVLDLLPACGNGAIEGKGGWKGCLRREISTPWGKDWKKSLLVGRNGYLRGVNGEVFWLRAAW